MGKRAYNTGTDKIRLQKLTVKFNVYRSRHLFRKDISTDFFTLSGYLCNIIKALPKCTKCPTPETLLRN